MKKSKVGEKTTKKENQYLFKNHCPDCYGQLKEGPEGGGSTNYICNCGSAFNFSVYFERIK